MNSLSPARDSHPLPSPYAHLSAHKISVPWDASGAAAFAFCEGNTSSDDDEKQKSFDAGVSFIECGEFWKRM